MTTQLPDPANAQIDPTTGLPLVNPNAKMQEVTVPQVPDINQETSTPPAPGTPPAPTDGSQPVPGTPAPTPGSTPAPSPTAPTLPQNNAQEYIVQPGDTINTIAQRLGVPPASISGFKSGNPNKIAVGEKLNVSASPAAPTTKVATPLPQNPTAMTGQPSEPTPTGKTPFQNVMDTYTQVYQELGLGNLKTRYSDALKQVDEIQKELNDKITEVNSNPWLSSQSRSDQIDKLKEKFTPRLDAATHLAQLVDSLAKEGEQTAQFLVGHVESDTNKAIELAQKKQDALDKLAQQDIHPADVNGRVVLVDYKTKKIIADLGSSKDPSSGGTGGLSNVQIDNGRAIATSFEGSPIVKNFVEIQSKFLNAKQYTGRGDGATDIATIYDLMKVLDPTSVVRNEEYNTGAAKSGNIFAGALARFNGMIDPKGGFVSDQAKTNIFQVINDRYNVAKKQYDNFYSQKKSQVDAVAPGYMLTDYAGGLGDTPSSVKGKTNDLDFVEQSLSQNKLNYDQALKLVPPGKIGAIRNDTGALVSIDPSEFNSATYTKL